MGIAGDVVLVVVAGLVGGVLARLLRLPLLVGYVAAGSDSAINQNTSARYQTGMVALEAEVKDSRFPDGWAFFDFGQRESLRDAAEPLGGERVARCIECHTKHTAVERTFVQFYPTLLEVARKMGTVKPGH